MCSCCGCQDITVIGRLMADHEAIRNAAVTAATALDGPARGRITHRLAEPTAPYVHHDPPLAPEGAS